MKKLEKLYKEWVITHYVLKEKLQEMMNDVPKYLFVDYMTRNLEEYRLTFECVDGTYRCIGSLYKEPVSTDLNEIMGGENYLLFDVRCENN